MLLFVATLVGFSSCSDDDNDDSKLPDVVEFNGVYILNSGAYTNNNPSLVYYDFKSTTTSNLFEIVNGIKLGDTAQDMIMYGSKTYVAMYGSGLIYVLDKNSKILATIKNDSSSPSVKLQPRSLEAYKGKVYVTLFDGYLARIDTTTMAIDKKVAVGANPEGVKAVNNKIYVANSGGMNWANGYNNTVSVLDLDLLTKNEIIVAMNPNELKVDKYNNLYLVSRGNFGNIPNILQQINTTTDVVTTLDSGRSFSVFPEGDKLYMLKKEYDANNLPSSTFVYYDIIKKEVVEQSFITDGTAIKDISFVKSEPKTGDIYVLAADASNNGDGYIFSSAGKLKSKFDTGAPYPVTISFINK